jgi:hypothetical protein
MNKLLRQLEKYSDDQVFTVGQVAALLKRHRDRVHDYIRKKRLLATFNETHKAYEIKLVDLQKFITEDFSQIPQQRESNKVRP